MYVYIYIYRSSNHPSASHPSARSPASSRALRALPARQPHSNLSSQRRSPHRHLFVSMEKWMEMDGNGDLVNSIWTIWKYNHNFNLWWGIYENILMVILEMGGFTWENHRYGSLNGQVIYGFFGNTEPHVCSRIHRSSIHKRNGAFSAGHAWFPEGQHAYTWRVVYMHLRMCEKNIKYIWNVH